MKLRKPKDALGNPISADTIYTALLPFAGNLNGAPKVFNPSISRLRGDHPAVQTFPEHFVPKDTDGDVLGRARGARLFPPPTDTPTPRVPPIPLEHQAVASETFLDGKTGTLVTRGHVYRDDHPVVTANRGLFHRPPQPIEAA